MGCEPVPDSQRSPVGRCSGSLDAALTFVRATTGIITVVVLTVVYVVARKPGAALPVAAAAAAAGIAWALAHVAKAITDRPRPYEAIVGSVLRQQPAHGTSFPSSHTAVTLAVAIALVPFLTWPLATAGITYAVWWGGPGFTWGSIIH